jgi:LPS export ABC transporter protein LptC
MTLLGLLLLLLSCTFDYGDELLAPVERPDLIMEDLEYVRVRNGDPLVRFIAKSAERYEKRQTMNLKEFSFEQFDHHGEDVNASGKAGSAAVELDSGNLRLEDGVTLEVTSEDISIETESLEWQDRERILSADEHNNVDMWKSDGTRFSGRGFSANVRERTWSFSGGISGVYVSDDDDDEE